MENKIGLGKGLSAIMGEIESEIIHSRPLDAQLEQVAAVEKMPLDKLIPGQYQPRQTFKEEELADLVSSIKNKGVLQPLLVRKKAGKEDFYEIIAGERRWRASRQAGLEEVPVIIKDFSDKETLEVALIENLQRQDLNPLEEAQGYLRLLKEFNHTQEGLASVVGKSRPYVANMMRLLGLPESVKQYLEQGVLSAGHARALLNSKNPEKLAKKVIDQGLNVRQTEHLAVIEGEKKQRESKTISVGGRKDSDIMAVEAELSTLLKTTVNIKWSGRNGKITIDCNSLEKLDQILQRLTTGGALID